MAEKRNPARKYRSGLILAATLFSSDSIVAQGAKSVPVADDKKTETAIEQLEKNLPTLMKEADVPGLSIALIRDGKPVWTRGFGVKNSETKEAVTEETVFEAASLSKPVFAYSVLKLVDAGKLDLDAPLNKYLPGSYDVAPDDARVHQITARRVLTHSTGFPNWRQPRNAKTLPVHFTPGERFSYSGEGFVYLSRAVEQITGMKFDEYVREAVFKPLAMTSSSFSWQDRYKQLKAFNHDALGNPTGQGENNPMDAAGSLLTTSADYAKFVAAILTGVGLNEETRRQMLAPQIRVDDACRACTDRKPGKLSTDVAWGLGWGLQTTDEGNSIWHWGDNGNNKAFVVAFEEQRDGIVLLANGANGFFILKDILADGLGGKHPALAWINTNRYDWQARVLLKSIVTDGPEKAVAAYRQRRAASPTERMDENRINSLGYDLLRARKADGAISLFRLNAEDFPNSANAWDSLAEAYMLKGDKVKAIEYYKKSLALNPNNKGAAERVKQLAPPE
jgi:CubicO group peptidase (beta-lactamase class C family)